MRYDISLHPVSEKQIQEWYFDVLENPELIEELARKYNIYEEGEDGDFYVNKYREIIFKHALKATNQEDFDHTHGYYIAVVQGFFEEFFYVRGAAFSFIKNPLMERYYRKWEDFIPEKYKSFPIHNQIISNYYSGKYIPYEQVCNLLDDYENDEKIKAVLDEQFSHKRINVLLKALRFAQSKEVGLLESDGVMEPHPADLNNSVCYSNLFHCDIEGPLLFQEAVIEQMKEAERQQEEKQKEQENNKKSEKKGFWGRVFKK